MKNKRKRDENKRKTKKFIGGTMKKTILITILLSLFQVSVVMAQITFERTYGGSQDEFGYSVKQTLDGGYIIAGHTDSYGAGLKDGYLIKTDSLANELWVKTYGGTSWDRISDVQQIISLGTAVGYIATGYTNSYGTGDSDDAWLIKTNLLGDTLWTKTYGGSANDWAFSLQQTSDAGYILAGETYSYGSGENDVYIIKTDTWGDTLWTRIYGSFECDRAYSIQETSDGGYIITGYTGTFPDFDALVIKTNSVGDTLWTRTYGGTGNGWDDGYYVIETGDGNYVITGQYCNPSDEGNWDVWLIKLDPDGNTIWERTYGGPWDSRGNSVQQTADGGYIIVGYTDSYGAGGYDVYLIKTDSFGDTIWTKTYGGNNIDQGMDVHITSDCGYIIAGATDSYGAGSHDVYLIKTNSSGTQYFGTIAGTVSEADNGPIIGASVQTSNALGITFSDITNEQGYYMFQVTAGENYDICASATGYNPDTIFAVPVYANNTTIVDFMLTHPEISIFPTSFEITLNEGEVCDTSMFISNSGDGLLEYNISVISRSGKQLSQIRDTGDIIQSINLTETIGQPLAAITFNGSYYWIAAWDMKVYKLDSEFNLISSYYTFGTSSSPATMLTWDGTYLYQGSMDNGNIYKVDISSGYDQVGDPIATGISFLMGGDFVDGYWYVTDGVTGTVYKYNTDFSEQIWATQIVGAAPPVVTYGVSYMPGTPCGGSVWVNDFYHNEIYELDAMNGNTIQHFLGPGTPGEATIAGSDWTPIAPSYLWISHMSDMYLYQIDSGYDIGISWLFCNPISGTVEPGETTEVEVTFDATDLTDSLYFSNIAVNNNSVNNPIIIPSTLHVNCVDIEENNPFVSTVYSLSHNYPNPFSNSTTFKFALAGPTHVKLSVYNIKGQHIATVVDEEMKPGFYEIPWSLADAGHKLTNGIYFYRLEAGEKTFVKKMVIMK
jgi:hypothetical protein